MATLDDDFVRINRHVDSLTFLCGKLGLSWPPPQVLVFHGFVYTLIRMSDLTDEESLRMPNVARAAEYNVATDPALIQAALQHLRAEDLMTTAPDGKPPSVH